MSTAASAGSAATDPVAAADALAGTSPAVAAALAEFRRAAGRSDHPLERHGTRMVALIDLLAERNGVQVDREVVIVTAYLHDIGIFHHDTGDAYVTEGRDVAAELLAPFEWTAERLRTCLDAIEQHHALRSRWELGPEVELTRQADLIEVSAGLVRFGLSRDHVAGVNAPVPRDGIVPALAKVVAGEARARPLSMWRIMFPPTRPA